MCAVKRQDFKLRFKWWICYFLGFGCVIMSLVGMA